MMQMKIIKIITEQITTRQYQVNILKIKQKFHDYRVNE